jgi:AcrR family transcriptional regulator
MTKAALYYHFPSKQDVLAALVEPWLEEIDALAVWAESQRPVDRSAALRTVIAHLATPNPTFGLLASDPSAMHDSAARLNPRARLRRLERAFAGSDDDAELLAVRCALGAVRAGILGTLLERDGADVVFTARELEAVRRAGLAAWEAARD